MPVSEVTTQTPILQEPKTAPDLRRTNLTKTFIGNDKGYINLFGLFHFIHKKNPGNSNLWKNFAATVVHKRNYIYFNDTHETEERTKLLNIYLPADNLKLAIQQSNLINKDQILNVIGDCMAAKPDVLSSHAQLIASGARLASSDETAADGIVGQCATFLANKMDDRNFYNEFLIIPLPPQPPM